MPTPIEIPPDVLELLNRHAPVAVGVSGGKDSVACALAVNDALNDLGHRGARILIHADLGMVEWADSEPSCARVSQRINWPLHVTKRQAGGMMERWEGRWAANVKRYQELSCVKLILPWSTPSMRFCTAELKRDPICSYLKKTFGKQPILSVTGIRADESATRAKMPSSRENPRLPTGSLDWNPLIRWDREAVFRRIASAGLALHEAYSVFGSSRVSCAFCIMSTEHDLTAALKDARNRPLFYRMVSLEMQSAFAFQGGRWLAELSMAEFAGMLGTARAIAEHRAKVEAEIPKHLLFEKGWPNVMPTEDEAELMAVVRSTVCVLYGWPLTFCKRQQIVDRYAALMQAKLLPKKR